MWATPYIEKLKRGEAVQFRPRGQSMKGKIDSGQLVTVGPVDEVSVGDIVLCKVRGKQYLHFVKATRGNGRKVQYLIGNNRGGTNGWISRSAIYGICTAVE